MRILIYGLNYAPELTGIGKYTGEMAEYLARRGHEVTVVTAPPYYPYWKVQPPYRACEYKHEKRNGVDVYRCPLWVPSRPSGLKRVLHLDSFLNTSAPILFRQMLKRPDIVMAVEPSVFTTAVVAWLAPLFGIKSWLHVQDFELDAAFSLGILRSPTLHNSIKALDRWIRNRFDRVSSISNAMVRRLKDKGLSAEKVRLFINWTESFQQAEPSAVESLRKEFGIPTGAAVVLYSGNIGRKQGLDILPQLAQAAVVAHPNVFFVVVGEGPLKAELEEAVRAQKLNHVLFFPLQPKEKLPILLSMADIHLVLQRREAADLVMPSKLGPILSVGGVALITADPGTELYHLAHDQKAGLVAEPESVEAIVNGISRLLQDETLRKEISFHARCYAMENLNKEKTLNFFEQQLQELLV